MEFSTTGDSTHPLFPLHALAHVMYGFTTSTSLASLSDVFAYYPLNYEALGLHAISKRMPRALVAPPLSKLQDQLTDSSIAWEAFFPRGSVNPSNKNAPIGGFGFYLHGPPEFAAVLKDMDAQGPGVPNVVMSYEVMFEDGFEWALGGKLPGIYGGVGDKAFGCTGGRKQDRCQCFNLRLMWRASGLGELYAYVPPSASNSERLLATPPDSLHNLDFGISTGRGAWTFEAGRWTAIAQRVRMNTVGKEDGEVEVFVDGKSVIHVCGLVLRTEPEGHIQGLHLETFFGGSKAEWASPRAQSAWFRGISGAILRSATDSHNKNVRHDEL